MIRPKLLAVTIENFKSIYEKTRIELGQLTIFVGKNNSGKSTINQALLLLKQTLELARVETSLHLDGYVFAINLRELISGWPSMEEDRVAGPRFSIEWMSIVNVNKAMSEAGNPDRSTLMEKASLPWLSTETHLVNLFTKMDLAYSDINGKVSLDMIELSSSLTPDFSNINARVRFDKVGEGRYECRWNDQIRKKMEVNIHHFFPSVAVDRRNMGPRHTERSLANAFLILFTQPLDALEFTLSKFSYLSSIRSLPPHIYPPALSGSEDIGVTGEFAPQLLYAHRMDNVHYLLPDFDDINIPLTPRQAPLVMAVNEVLAELGIDTPLSIDEIERIGFRLMFGKATLSHVGRGLTYLLPIVQLGLFNDPFRKLTFQEDYNPYDEIHDTAGIRLCAFEEPESHLHPKVQSRLAIWFVALAKADRQIIVETHSDHLVRKLRALLAQSSPGSVIEKWLQDNIRIVNVSKDVEKTKIETTTISRVGGLEVWPADFMDAAVKGEQDIYYAALEKDGCNYELSDDIIHEAEDEPDAID
jgi:energy-coupling factor transporter ATP-binding protein EcfA2